MNFSSSCVCPHLTSLRRTLRLPCTHICRMNWSRFFCLFFFLPEYQWWRTSVVHALVITARFLRNNRADLATHSEMCQTVSRNSSWTATCVFTSRGFVALHGFLVTFYPGWTVIAYRIRLRSSWYSLCEAKYLQRDSTLSRKANTA